VSTSLATVSLQYGIDEIARARPGLLPGVE